MVFTFYTGDVPQAVVNIDAEDVLEAAVEVGRIFPMLAGENQFLTTGEGGHTRMAVVMHDGQRHMIQGEKDAVAAEVCKVAGSAGGYCLIVARTMAIFSYAPPVEALLGLRAALLPVLT